MLTPLAGLARLPQWGNDGLDAKFGFRLPVQEFVERDLASIGKFSPQKVVSCWHSRTVRRSAQLRSSGLEVRAYVHELYRHLAGCDLAVVA